MDCTLSERQREYREFLNKDEPERYQLFCEEEAIRLRYYCANQSNDQEVRHIAETKEKAIEHKQSCIYAARLGVKRQRIIIGPTFNNSCAFGPSVIGIWANTCLRNMYFSVQLWVLDINEKLFKNAREWCSYHFDIVEICKKLCKFEI